MACFIEMKWNGEVVKCQKNCMYSKINLVGTILCNLHLIFDSIILYFTSWFWSPYFFSFFIIDLQLNLSKPPLAHSNHHFGVPFSIFFYMRSEQWALVDNGHRGLSLYKDLIVLLDNESKTADNCNQGFLNYYPGKIYYSWKFLSG